jgi:hypothetical protein
MHFAMRTVSPTGSETDIFQRVADFMKSDHPEFRKGFDAATKTCAYGAGGEVKPNDPDVLAAEHTTKLLVERGAYAEADRGTIAGMLTATLFYNVVLNHGSDELNEFLVRMRTMDDLALTAAQVADLSSRMRVAGIDLHSPREALAKLPQVLPEITEAVIKMQAEGRQVEVPGVMVWVLTLRAVNRPAQRELVKEMWTRIAGAFPGAPRAAANYEILTGRRLNLDGVSLRVPEEFSGPQ